MSKSRPSTPIHSLNSIPAHMTWASRSVSGTVTRARRFLGSHLWAWPIVAVTALLVLGWLVNGAIERTMKANLAAQLTSLRDIEVDNLRNWLKSQENNARSVAGDADVRRLTVDLLSESPNPDSARDLARAIRPELNSHDYENFAVFTPEKVIATSRAEAVGMEVTADVREMLSGALEGVATVTRPYASRLTYVTRDGKLSSGVPMMFALAPVLDDHLQVIAVLGLQIRPDVEFTRRLQLGRLGKTGETYAFDSNGLMLSGSRFDHELRLDGLLREDDESLLNLLVRDPGGDVTRGYRPKVLRSELPLTRMAASAVQGETGLDVSGYRDYRGAKVVGAWTWLDEYGMGVATEIDFTEAFLPLTILKRTFWALLFLLAASSVAIFVFTLMMARLRRQAREAAIEAKQLGQYKLEQKLGSGAMGVVYKGQHAMLRRPTAIKLLSTDNVTEKSISGFEREVQITSNLNHPNTIAIYDYGHTPEGVFYYAMEYLDGIDLQKLIADYGPQPPGRVIFILDQICGSLYEAHSTGLVHRDIKPANVMINYRGGRGDVVKVLDFGLVKARDDRPRDGERESMAGTPLYMSPEAIQLPGSVDACSDLYAVGAVGYFLLTGTPVFGAATLVELCQMHTSEPPQPPSERLGKPVPPGLEHALLACLEKSRAKRPQTARELANLLAACAESREWTLDKADAWWSAHQRGQRPPGGGDTDPGDHDATMLFE